MTRGNASAFNELEGAPPRAVLAQRFAELFSAAGNPSMRRVATMVNARAQQAHGKGRDTTVSSQRISDWAAGRNTPARFESFEPVLTTLIGMASRQGHPVDHPLLDLRRWQQLWIESNGTIPRTTKISTTVPYFGLKSYRRDDKELFFGRRRATEALEAMVQKAIQDHDSSGLAVLVGASGAGKSSLLEAGLIPALTESSDEWEFATCKPGSAPVASLRKAIDGGGDDYTVADALDKWAPDRDRLLVVDQFEELFTACEDEHERHTFLNALGQAAAPRQGHASIVIIAVRADFYARCLDYPMLAAALNHHSYVLDSMRLDELREVMTGPTRLAGLVLEPGLQELVISELCGANDQGPDAVAGAGTLPLLSHVMEAIWQKRDGKRLTVDGYRQSGGVVGSVATTAERAWDVLTESQQTVAKQILLRLVAIGQSSRDTRKTVSRAELLQYCGDVDLAERALETLTSARLITADGDSIYLTHEIVLRVWPRLRRWIDEHRAEYLVSRQLEIDAAQWEAADRDESLLYRGARLKAAQNQSSSAPIFGHTREFLATSIAESRRAQRHASVTKSVMAILGIVVLVMAVGFYDRSRMAEQQRADAVFREILAQADGLQDIDPSMSAQLDLVAYRLRPDDPEVRARLLKTQTLPLATPLIGPDSPVYYVAFSSQGLLASTYGDGSIQLWDTTEPTHPYRIGAPITGISGFASAASFSPDGKVLAVGGEDHDVTLWDVSDPAKPRMSVSRLSAGKGAIYNILFSPDGRMLAASNDDHSVALWNVDNPAKPAAIGWIGNQSGAIRSIAFSPNDSLLATASDDHTVQLWNITDARTAPTPTGSALAGFSAVAHAVAFSPDSSKLAGASDDGIVQIWDVSDPATPHPTIAPLSAHPGEIWSVAFGPSGRTLVTAGTEGTAKIWNLDSPHPQTIGRSLAGTKGGVFGVAISPDQRTVATGSQDGVVRLWSLPGKGISTRIGEVNSLALDSQSGILATISPKGRVQLWNTLDPLPPHHLSELTTNARIQNTAIAPGGRTLAVLQQSPSELQFYDISNPFSPQLTTTIPLASRFALNAVFSPNSPTLVSNEDEHSLRVWNISDLRHPIAASAPIVVSTGWIASMRYSPDGKLLATAESTGSIKLWDMSNPAQPRRVGADIHAGTGSVSSIALSPDGRMLAAAGEDKLIRLWDISKPAEPSQIGSPLVGHNSGVHSLDFSPDGKTLASGAYDGEVRLWDISDPAHPRSPIELSVMPSTAAKRKVKFDGTGEYLVVSGYNQGLLMWDLNSDHMIGRICDVTRTVMTPESWAQVLPSLPYQAPCH
ncbi:hypothetical protein [Nocardia sp. NPDC051570]|uniref:nSTAND1 domain-containing NTPase n=1 Tax=Nocardia sp. NPDC051570 TaxID=3364324 RepID=UPI0037B2E0E7